MYALRSTPSLCCLGVALLYAVSVTAVLAIDKIDTHHHLVPPFYAKILRDTGGDPTGGAPPNWTVEATEAAMQRLGVKTTIFSISTPGATIYEGQASYNLARQLNEYSASIRDAQPSKFGFFANLPSILDTNATLDEITHSLDILHADGVALFTRYGKGYTYLGHPSIEPVWAELNRRRAVVFIHPTDLVKPTLISPRMVQPFIDYPHETARTAVDMMTSGMRLKYPNCSVILSHAGGTLPSLVPRILGGSSPEDLAQSPNSTAALLWKAFQSFHFDIANAVSHPNLRLLLKLIPHDHLTYGSDYPYAPTGSDLNFLKEWESFNISADLRAKINHGNAEALFPRLKQ